MLDTVNACFEAVAAVLVWLNVRRLARDRVIRGVDWKVTAFTTAWGAWSVAYYVGLEHWFSCAASAGVCFGNATWTVIAIGISRAEVSDASRQAQADEAGSAMDR